MNNFIKVSLTFGLLSVSSLAMANNPWYHIGAQAYKYPIVGQANITIYQIEQYPGKDGKIKINYGFRIIDKTCKALILKNSGDGYVTIDGELIKTGQHCVDDGHSFHYAATDEGANFIEKEFTNQPTVQVKILGDEYIFSTAGFTKAKNIVEQPLYS